MATVNMKYMPTPNTEQVVNLTMLNGGLNLSELDYRLKVNESPQMRNLMWRDGVLCCRDGQEWVWSGDGSSHTAYAMYNRLFHGMLVIHVDNQIWLMNPVAEDVDEEIEKFSVSAPANSGAFFLYNSKLYYKNRGGYFVIAYDPTAEHPFSVAEVPAYTPVTVINASPENGSGSLYQPENRISPKKTIWYNASGGAVYHLPTTGNNNFIEVEVDGVAQERGADKDFIYDWSTGIVTFNTGHEPPTTTPPSQNTVHITYSKTNTAAYNSVMDCIYAAVYGGTGELCVVMGGSLAQPNAIFWNGIGQGAAMDPGYFPMLQYQLVGSSDDPVTGFGKQQSFLVVFQEHSVGRVKQDITTVDDRATIDMPYVAINAKIGCDLPKTIQLINNNLVWCNQDQGVHILKDSSYAYENNIECVSLKVNGSTKKPGLLENVRRVNAVNPEAICSMDDEKRYWLCVDGTCWVWDYEFSTYKDPSWYYMTNIYGRGFCTHFEDSWHVDAQARVTHFTRNYCDYDDAIDKSYRFATQFFGGYDRLKNVNSVIISVRPDTNSDTTVTYLSDYETRKDLTNLQNFVWTLVPWNIKPRPHGFAWSLSGVGYGTAFRRRPMCRRVKHFAMQLDNNIVAEDLSIVSAQIFFNFQGRLR